MRKLQILMTAVASLTLAACGANSMGTSNTSLYSVHQPVIERTNFAIDLAGDGGSLSSVEQGRLSDWFDALGLRYGDRVSVDHGSEYSSPVINGAVARAVADRGLSMEGPAPVTSGPIAPGMVRVVVTRSKASVPSCPDFSVDHERNYNASNHSNYGCATNSNFAAMIADPEDLVRGRDGKRLDANTGRKAVDGYRSKTGGN